MLIALLLRAEYSCERRQTLLKLLCWRRYDPLDLGEEAFVNPRWLVAVFVELAWIKRLVYALPFLRSKDEVAAILRFITDQDAP